MDDRNELVFIPNKGRFVLISFFGAFLLFFFFSMSRDIANYFALLVSSLIFLYGFLNLFPNSIWVKINSVGLTTSSMFYKRTFLWGNVEKISSGTLQFNKIIFVKLTGKSAQGIAGFGKTTEDIVDAINKQMLVSKNT